MASCFFLAVTASTVKSHRFAKSARMPLASRHCFGSQKKKTKAEPARSRKITKAEAVNANAESSLFFHRPGLDSPPPQREPLAPL